MLLIGLSGIIKGLSRLRGKRYQGSADRVLLLRQSKIIMGYQGSADQVLVLGQSMIIRCYQSSADQVLLLRPPMASKGL